MRATRAAPTPFVGRERELSTISERLASAAEGEGGIVCISGEPGIGKSRLLHELAAIARRAGWRVLSGRAYDMEGMPPYLPIIEGLREHLRESSDQALAQLAADSPALALLLPELQGRMPAPVRPPALGPDGERLRIFETISGFLTRTAREGDSSGLLVILDDLHWADTTTLLLLQHLARKLSGSPLLIATAYRPTDIEQRHPLNRVLADLAREHLCESITLAPLTERDTSALIEAATGRPAAATFVRELHRETAGNPFFIEEVLFHLAESGVDLSLLADGSKWDVPDSVRQVIRQRISRLAPGTDVVLQEAAVLGDAFDFDLLVAATGAGLEPLTSAVEDAERAGMLRRQADGYAFAHCLIRRTIYDDLSIPRRRQAHQRAAEAMEASRHAVASAGPAVIGNHWRLAGRPECAVDPLLRAGDNAIGVTAWEEATRHWEAALECMEQTGERPTRRARLLEGLGDLYYLSSFEAHPSTERYLEACRLYEGAGDPMSAARARARAGRSLAFPTSGFDYAAALEHFRAAELILSAEPPGIELGELYASLVHAEYHALLAGPADRSKTATRLEEIASGLDNDFLRELLRTWSLHMEGHYLGAEGHLGRSLDLMAQTCQNALALEARPGLLNQWREQWRDLLLAHSGPEEPPLSSEGSGSYQFSRMFNSVAFANMTINCYGWHSTDLDDPIQARAQHERPRDAQERFLSPFLVYDLFLAADLRTLRRLIDTRSLSPMGEAAFQAPVFLAWGEGRPERAERYLTRLAAMWRTGSSKQIVFANRFLLRLYRGVGLSNEAQAVAEESLNAVLGTGAIKYEFAARAELGLLAAEAGRLPEAEQHLARCREILAEGEDWRGLGGRASLAEAVFAAATGHRDESEALFARAVHVFGDLCLPWDEAEAHELWARASAQFSRGRVRRASVADRLQSARAVYERVGAGQPWLDRVDAQERSLLGAVPEAATPDFPDGLTPREAEILRMVAAGSSSREVGESLVLSVRTVERHIANAYLKTGTHNRAQMTAYALAHGLTGD